MGEKLCWFRVASHLRVTVAELSARITYREFIDWLSFLDLEEERQTKLDYYLAQVAAEVRRGNVKNPKSVKTKDFLVQMKRTGPADKTAKSKVVWAGALGVKLKKD